MKKKLLFIDRDGTIIKEPPITYQVDTLQQLSFLPGVIRNLYRITKELDYELVMVSNQDGLGSEHYPEQNFITVQDKMLEILAAEGILFKAIHIDRSYAAEGLDTRKPGIGMLRTYLTGDYDMAGSYVIGDRLTDVKLAANLGAKAIFIRNYEQPVTSGMSLAFVTDTWDDIYTFLTTGYRKFTHTRTTAETDITVTIDLDGNGAYDINTGIGFFDHMLQQFARHSNIDLHINSFGDLHVDEHHTIEDTAIALAEAFSIALGNKRGIERYGYCLPMDDCLAQVAIDFGGRGWLEWETTFQRERIGDMPTEMFYHFFRSFCDAGKCNLNIKAEGTNEHHKIEAIFKAFARSVGMAVRVDRQNMSLPTTKGMI